MVHLFHSPLVSMFVPLKLMRNHWLNGPYWSDGATQITRKKYDPGKGCSEGPCNKYDPVEYVSQLAICTSNS